jgi:hypothetical protein
VSIDAGGAMPAKRLPMRQVRDVLRLKHACGMSERLIAQALGLGRTTVRVPAPGERSGARVAAPCGAERRRA